MIDMGAYYIGVVCGALAASFCIFMIQWTFGDSALLPWNRRDRVLLIDATGMRSNEVRFAYAKQINGIWFANYLGGQFSENTAVILNADGSTTGSATRTWWRLAGMDGFGPTYEGATPDTADSTN